MTRPDRPDDDDELLQRYRDASAADPTRPSAHVRDAVQAHARMLAAAQRQQPATAPVAAANQPRWLVPMLASVAMFGLASLLVLQWDEGTLEEQELVRGAPAPVAPSVPMAESVPQQPQPQPAARESTAPAADPAPPAAAAMQAQRPVRAQDNATQPRPSRAAPALTERRDGTGAPATADSDTTLDSATERRPAPAALQRAEQAAAKAQAQGPSTRGQADDTIAPSMAAPEAGSRRSLAAGAGQPAADNAQRLRAAARGGDLARIDALVAAGSIVDQQDAGGRSALMLAAIHGHEQAVARLLDAGADRELRDRDGYNALDHARRQGHERVVRLLENPR